MCRINILGIPVSEQNFQKEYLKKYDYARFFSRDGYAFFFNSPCNCDSMVGCMSETEDGVCSQEHAKNSFETRLKKLYLLMDWMFCPEYEESQKIYEKKLEENDRQLNALYEPIAAFENDFLEKLEQKHLPDKEEEKEMERLQKRLSILYKEMENSPEYLAWKKESENLKTGRNEVFFLAAMYAKGKNQEKPCIDDAVMELEEKRRELLERIPDEFVNIKNMMQDFLQKGSCILFGTVWENGMSSKDTLVRQIKTLEISELEVRDLAQLAFGEVIKVC